MLLLYEVNSHSIVSLWSPRLITFLFVAERYYLLTMQIFGPELYNCKNDL
jgi:hypothetical protein